MAHDRSCSRSQTFLRTEFHRDGIEGWIIYEEITFYAHGAAYQREVHEHGDQDVTKELAIWKINFDEEACGISIHSWQQTTQP